MNIGIVGLGLLGGSFSLALQELKEEHHFIGVDINPEHQKMALEIGLANEIKSFEDTARLADLFVLATPVNVLNSQLLNALDLLRDDAIVIDFGSTKELFAQTTNHHPKRSRYVSCHPIAGTENSGPDAAFAHLLRHKMMIICDKELSDRPARKSVEKLFKKLEMRLSYMSSNEHDRHIAYVSHLSHISSFALGLTVLEKEQDEKSIFTMAGSGFSSTVRLAKSSPAMWSPIFSQNKDNVSQALGDYIKMLEKFKEIIDSDNMEMSYDMMKEANDIRRVLLGIDLSSSHSK